VNTAGIYVHPNEIDDVDIYFVNNKRNNRNFCVLFVYASDFMRKINAESYLDMTVETKKFRHFLYSWKSFIALMLLRVVFQSSLHFCDLFWHMTGHEPISFTGVDDESYSKIISSF
jgi:hypothetical protein